MLDLQTLIDNIFTYTKRHIKVFHKLLKQREEVYWYFLQSATTIVSSLQTHYASSYPSLNKPKNQDKLIAAIAIIYQQIEIYQDEAALNLKKQLDDLLDVK